MVEYVLTALVRNIYLSFSVEFDGTASIESSFLSTSSAVKLAVSMSLLYFAIYITGGESLSIVSLFLSSLSLSNFSTLAFPMNE